MAGIFGDGQRGGIFGAKVDPRLQAELERWAAAKRQEMATAQEPSLADQWHGSLANRILSAPSKLFGGLVADPAMDLATLAGDVIHGRQPTMAADPQTAEFHTDPRLIERTNNAAGMLTLGAGAIPAEANALRMGIRAEPLASKSHLIYNPPMKSPRAFEEDYKGGARVDEAGNLTHDIEGNPLTARLIAGRRRSGEPDIGLTPADIKALAEDYLGSRISAVRGSEIGGDAGQLIMGRIPETGAEDIRIAINSSLTPERAERVAAHEVSHLIDQLAEEIPAAGISKELRQVYNTMTTGRERTKHLTGPQHLNYRGEDIPRELMAEAIRAYMQDPNYLKKMAPRTAEAIRAAVNKNPPLAQSIQFNVGGIPLPLPDDEKAK